MFDAIDKAFADAIHPQLRNTRDSKLRAESRRRARKARAALYEAGFEIVPRTDFTLAEALPEGDEG